MIKLMKYLKKSAGYVVLIIALLFLQAYCDLSLPDYTSKIVDVYKRQDICLVWMMKEINLNLHQTQ